MRRAIPVVLVLAVVLAGCAASQNQIANGYKSLATAGTAYDTAMKSIADLHKQGVVDDDVKAKAIELGNYFWSAYHTAVDTLETAAETGDAEAANRAVEYAMQAHVSFMEYVKPLITGGE